MTGSISRKLIAGLDSGQGDSVYNVLNAASARKIIAGLSQSLKYGIAFCPADALRNLVTDIAGLQVGKNENIGMPCHRTSGGFQQTDFRHQGRIQLHFTVQKKIRCHFMRNLYRTAYLIHHFMFRAAFCGKGQQRYTWFLDSAQHAGGIGGGDSDLRQFFRGRTGDDHAVCIDQ